MIDIDLPEVVNIERPQGGADAIANAAAMLSDAEFPVILSGAGVVLAGPSVRLPIWLSGSMRRSAPAISTMTVSRAVIRWPVAPRL